MPTPPASPVGRRFATRRWVAVAVLLPVLAACSPRGDDGPSEQPSSVPGARVVATVGARAFPTLGQLLVDDTGRTLYVSSTERGGHVDCSGSCTDTWPLALVAASGALPQVSGGVQASLLGVTKAGTGTHVLTYAGFPLHVYVGDTGPGEDNGQGIQGQWSGITVAGAPAVGSPAG